MCAYDTTVSNRVGLITFETVDPKVLLVLRTTVNTIYVVLRHGENEMSIREVPTIGQGGRGGKAGEGSTIASQVEVAPYERKCHTSSNCKMKVDQNNPQPKRKRAKQASESDVQPGENRVEYGATSFFVRDRDCLTPGGAGREGTEISRTPTDGVGSEDNAVDIEGADSPSTSSDAEDEMAWRTTDDGRRDSGEGFKGARGRAATARRGGALTATTVGGSTGEGLASLQHNRAIVGGTPAGGRTVGSSGGDAARMAARGAVTGHPRDRHKGDRERAVAATVRRPELRRGWLGLNEVVHVHLLKYPLVKNTKTPISLIYHLFAPENRVAAPREDWFAAAPPEDRLKIGATAAPPEDRLKIGAAASVIHCMFLFDFLH
ncbi:hypothetical protein Syun_013693 [Stephania yunnanensis]|uniref:Uncharacterized protein n=1 Tax=Stephania yunnanensis TaxID=152371 RepID=A0AAP0P7Z2_9MAGN